ncbi:nucleoprotein TPR protein [Dioscorea alata]|uniref:Nucleoprotein TPR protein n=1 Tax=Dioscorea alata TaxID=55571 RepID=A0ACB7WLE4_DIOAL|nr:nucleoprotein TPR protein [Dioscorea alata]
MPLFLSEEEFRLCSHDASLVAERADAFIIELRRQLDTVRAEADAASIAAEQTCALLEQKYAALSSDLCRLQAENAQLAASAEGHLSEVAEARAEKHQLHLKAIGKDGEIERMNVEVSELHKSKRQLLELVAQKDVEISERNATIQSYLEKIVDLTENTTSKAAIIHENEAELSRCRATCERLSQEKELIEKHNAWLNEELNTKVNSLIELRKKHMEVEVDMSAKIADLEKQLDDSSNLYKRSKDRVHEQEGKLTSLEEDLHLSKDAAAANEERLATELSTVTRLVELHKASSEEWSKKAGELEGVIKALETHLNQVENDFKEKLEKEVSIRKDCEKETASLKDKLEKCEVEIENARKGSELSLLPISSYQVDYVEELVNDKDEVDDDNQRMIVPRIPTGISGTALAASLLRDGWSLAKMYEKYQETADALRHEKWGRKHSEAILERVLHEIEEKAELILEERAEHERMLEAYSLMDQRLQQALLEKDNFVNTIRKLKADLKRCDRDYTIAEKDISDLQKQVTVLLKECQDVQLRGATTQSRANNSISTISLDIDAGLDVERVISEHLLTFRDINELVEQNVKLRSTVRSLSSQVENKDSELKEGLQMELQKVIDDASAKVEAVLRRSEEQGRMIESLHSSVAMYKRLYEEERKMRVSGHPSLVSVHDGKKDLVQLLEGSQEVSKKAHEELADRARVLEEELTKMRNDVTSLRLERDRMSLEANFARERLDCLLKDTELQKQEANAVSARNVELTHLLVEYQKRVRESSDALNAAEDNARKLSMEISILKHEKEILSSSEERASAEVRSLSERVHRLQSSLDTIQSSEEIRENARGMEKRKLEEYLKRSERDWADAKRELQEERDHVRSLTHDKERALEKSMAQVEEMQKELADAWRAVASAESRAAVAEARCSNMEAKVTSSKKAIIGSDAAEDAEKLKEEAQANKNYMLQYKEIAQTNENALKQIELAHEEYKTEAERLKKALEAEVLSLKNKIAEIESFYASKSEEANRAMEDKEKALSSAMDEKSSLKKELAEKLVRIGYLEIQVSSLSDDLEKEHKRWRTAQDNYERQVILQSETIQELTNTSKELSRLQEEVSKLREISEAQKIENDILKSSGEKEKLVLQELKDEAERKYNDLNEQNKILHNRLESLHVRLAEREQNVSAFATQNIDSQTDSDVQTVINYLRRSKEIAETEISLLKQEKFRLQSQLESALKASETAQALLKSQHENSRAALLKEEEFKSLQFQVREINLLRESNLQLREENKHNFEESQKFRDECQKLKMETEKITNLLKEKEIELDSCQKVVAMRNVEIGHLQSRIAELLENCKNVDAGEYERMKDDLHQLKILLGESDTQLHLTKNLVSEKQELVSSLEENLTKCQSELAEQEKKLNDILQVEANIRQENEKVKKSSTFLKKKTETLSKEKEELTKENQALLKQLDELKSSRRTIGDNIASEQAMKEKEEKEKEKDTRIQTLERTLEREREENKKEKLRRLKIEKTVMDVVGNVNKEKKKVEDELAKQRNAIAKVLEGLGITASQLPDTSALDEQTTAFFLAADSVEPSVKSVSNDGQGTQSIAMETSPMDISITAAGSPIKGPFVTHQLRSTTQEVAEERDKRIVTKPIIEVRKAGRKIVRPRLEWSAETSTDVDMAGAEGSATEEGRALLSHEPEPSGVSSAPTQPSLSRKRPASSSASDLRESSAPDEASDVVNQLKRSRESEPTQEAGEEPPSGEASDTLHLLSPLVVDISDTQLPVDGIDADPALASLTEAETADAGKPEELEVSTKVEIEAQGTTLDNASQDVPQDEGDAAIEDTEKQRVATDSLDDAPKLEGNDVLQPAVDSDEGREEGELVSDESDQLQQQEEPSPVEVAHDSIPSDGGANGDETGEISDLAEVSMEKSESTEIVEDLAEASDKPTGNNNDPSASDLERSPQTSSKTREESPTNITVSAVTDPQTSVTTAESEEQRSGQTISIRERARRNAALRQAGIATPPPSATRGRGATRGFRGARGRRGSAFGDRKQS